jgi:hypothetical protein
MALTRADVNLRTGSVRVTRSLSDDRGRMALGPAEVGRRQANAIPDPVVPTLREHLRQFSAAGPGGRVLGGGEGSDDATTWATRTPAVAQLGDDLARIWNEGRSRH